MYPLFETIKIIDGIVQNADYHQNRINNSINNIFNRRNDKINIALTSIPQNFKSGIVKCKFLYNDNSFAREFSIYHKRQINNLKLVINDTISYSSKYVDRQQINLCFQEREFCDDIIIVKNGFLTDTSFSNLIFLDGKNWVTPKTYLLNGTCRQRLLNEGIITEKEIDLSNYKKFLGVKLINAMLDIDDTNFIGIDSLYL